MSALFGDLIGQPLAVDLLSAALAQERVAPAYLFAGPEGVGRQLAAVRFLEGLLADGQPSARERRRLLERNHPDLLWVCLLYTSTSPRDLSTSRMPSSA